MTITASVKTVVIDNFATADATIATTLNTVTPTSIYAVSIVPISNTQSKVIMIYA